MTNLLHQHTSMGGGASYQKMEDQEYHVSQNFEKEKERMSKHRYYDGEKMYSDSQIKMKLRQDYNSGGKTLSSYRADKDSSMFSLHIGTINNKSKKPSFFGLPAYFLIIYFISLEHTCCLRNSYIE